MGAPRPLVVAALLVAVAGGAIVVSQEADAPPGARDPAWAPDGESVAVSVLDQIWVMRPDGQDARILARWPDGATVVEREPAWSPDGRQIAFAADRGDGFDLYLVPADGGVPQRLTFLPDDERSPAWTPDGRLVFAHRGRGQWDLLVINVEGTAPGTPPVVHTFTSGTDDEEMPAVSPDGSLVAYVSSRQDASGQFDVWVRRLGSVGAPFDTRDGDLEAGSPQDDAPVRLTATPDRESHPAWDPSGLRLAYASRRDGAGAVWVASLPVDVPGLTRRPSEADDATAPVLVSRRAAMPAWSPDGRALLLADLPPLDPGYNGAPLRSALELPPVFDRGQTHRLRRVPAPLPPDAGEEDVASPGDLPPARWLLVFDRTWDLLRTLYYQSGAGADAWRHLRDVHRPRAQQARSRADIDGVLDALIDAQPLVRQPVASHGAVVVSGHPLASEIGRRVLARGGNVVDAAIAVSFALGVVEPDASGIGGDGMAMVLLAGMPEPVVVDYKDQSPIHATLNNTAIFDGGRLVSDGPASANIPGVVAGMEYLHRVYGSGRVPWRQLLEPAVTLAEDGFELDASLPSTLREGRTLVEKYPETRRVFFPDGRLPRPGDRFVNRDYGATLRAIASGGADAFYRGRIAQRIAEDMAANGGLIGLDDLAQYHVIERVPVSGHYRGLRVFGTPPPVSSGTALVETLQVLDRFTPAGRAVFSRDADLWHHAIEAWKVRDPLRRIADPALWPVDVSAHLDPARAAQLFERIDPAQAGRFAGDGDGVGQGQDDRLGRGTTAFAVGDADGNVIVVTQTLSTWGGSFYVSRGLGFLYNNHLRGYRTTRGAYGQLLPLMRSSTTNAPTLVCDEVEGVLRPRLAVGAAGNAWITSSVYGIVLAHVDGGLGGQAAVEAPRFLVARDPADAAGTLARVQIEDRFPGRVRDEMEARGHRFQTIGRKGELRYGYAAAITFDHAAGRVEGGAEPRRSHAAVALDP
jgi:gamma-glutamyltranspeptidase